MIQQILVLEDEPGIADTISYSLKTEGFKVLWKTTGSEALKAMQTRDISLVVLDIGLPDCNGLDWCRELRKTSLVPIIFLTARSDEVDRIVGLEIGGDDYLVKPFSPRELAARVKAVLRREGSPKLKKTSHMFHVDDERKQILYFGESLDLSRYEYRILEVLIRSPGRVFSRDLLMDLVWEEPEASLDRTVDTHIKTLRAKLREMKPALSPIQTHRGLGYSLKESL